MSCLAVGGDGCIYNFGGINTNVVKKFCPSTGNWTFVTTLPVASVLGAGSANQVYFCMIYVE